QNSIFYSLTLSLKPTTWEIIFSSLCLWSIVSARVHVQVPRKKVWVEKPITFPLSKELKAESQRDLCTLIKNCSLSFCSFTLGKLMRNLEYKKMRIILDSQTASGYLSVSPNGKSMMFTGLWINKCQHGQRFDPEPGVLGSKGFTWGKVYWEVKAMRYRAGNRRITGGYHSPGYREENEELQGEWSQEHGIWPKFCLLGVAREPVGFWTLQLSSAGVSICASPEPFQILSYCPWQIGVALDHDGGKVTFTNAR
ncbi:hypothetical protein FD754_025285, partial [Muntiacus muntjak]